MSIKEMRNLRSLRSWGFNRFLQRNKQRKKLMLGSFNVHILKYDGVALSFSVWYVTTAWFWFSFERCILITNKRELSFDISSEAYPQTETLGPFTDNIFQ